MGKSTTSAGLRQEADADYVRFWARQAAKLSWFRRWESDLEWDLPHARWFAGGLLNASHNALDVHQKELASKTAIIWEGEDGSRRTQTYAELLSQTERLAGALDSLGVQKGDCVTVYMPMVPEAIAAMLACARIGAPHSAVFSGFSAAALRQRISDSRSKVIITADVGYRRGKQIPLKKIADEASAGLDCVKRTVVLQRLEQMATGPRDIAWSDALQGAPASRPAEQLASDHPLFILYTSGTTGRPKGILHGTGGYLAHARSTFEWAFGPQKGDVYFCTADIGWVTGHTYMAYAPLMHGMTQVICEGAPDYPGPARIWDIVQRNRVSILYTTPTALRMHMRAGSQHARSCDLSSLRLLGTVGEPINPSVWEWYKKEIGGGRCPIIDTWWQTETGAMMASPLPGIDCVPALAGSAGLPIPGADMRVVDSGGQPVPPGTKGHLVIRRPWPGMLLGIWGDEERYRETYWSAYPGSYYAGDYARMDADGRLWILGRADDVIKVAGHRIGTAEIEDSMLAHPGVAEAAACAVADRLKGQAVIAFAVMRQGAQADDAARQGIVQAVRDGVGAIAAPSRIYFVPILPKTRSGKIMRRLLRAVAEGRPLGDMSTLEEGAAVSEVQQALEAMGRIS